MRRAVRRQAARRRATFSSAPGLFRCPHAGSSNPFWTSTTSNAASRGRSFPIDSFAGRSVIGSIALLLRPGSALASTIAPLDAPTFARFTLPQRPGKRTTIVACQRPRPEVSPRRAGRGARRPSKRMLSRIRYDAVSRARPLTMKGVSWIPSNRNPIGSAAAARSVRGTSTPRSRRAVSGWLRPTRAAQMALRQGHSSAILPGQSAVGSTPRRCHGHPRPA